MDTISKVEETWLSYGSLCVVRLGSGGYRCGYVGVSEDHPLYGKEYNEHVECLEYLSKSLDGASIGKRGLLSIFIWNGEKISPEIVFDVHGSLSYSSGDNNYPIMTNTPTWWFGYDCGHYGDGSKYCPEFPIRSLAYCLAECDFLAEQLSCVAQGKLLPTRKGELDEAKRNK